MASERRKAKNYASTSKRPPHTKRHGGVKIESLLFDLLCIPLKLRIKNIVSEDSESDNDLSGYVTTEHHDACLRPFTIGGTYFFQNLDTSTVLEDN